MRYIDQHKIDGLLQDAVSAAPGRVDSILEKSKSLQRLSLEETAVLLAAKDPQSIAKIFDTAAYVKDAIYGKRIVLFAPLYISSYCANTCLYCAFKSDNQQITRKHLSQAEIQQQVEWLLKRGHKRILAVAGEPEASENPIDYYVASINTIYSASVGLNKIRRVNINCAPLSVADFKKLKAAGIGTFQLFQETYHEQTYRTVHIKGPKCDPDNRLDAIDRAFAAGIDDVGIGVLYGLYDYRFETLAMLMHIEHLEKKFNIGPHTISVPRIEPADGSDFSKNPPHKVSDDDFKKVVAVLRLAVPYTGIILSTRETAAMRDTLVRLGVSQMSAASSTVPGGYSHEREGGQFDISDARSLDEVIAALIAKGLIPSFCAACYRKERTGEAFMTLAKPGAIKDTCSINALVTLKEYLDDFASDAVRHDGYRLIKNSIQHLNPDERGVLESLFRDIDAGSRDRYV